MLIAFVFSLFSILSQTNSPFVEKIVFLAENGDATNGDPESKHVDGFLA